MLLKLAKLFVILLALMGAPELFAQTDPLPEPGSRSDRRDGSLDRPSGLDEMLAKQRAQRHKKNHEEMLERGEEALRLANQLEASFSQNKAFSSHDKAKLESLERVVLKIREDLGGDDEDEDKTTAEDLETDGSKPPTVEEAFKDLRSTTVKLVDELKRTTRYSISVIAIKSSNSVLRLVKFLRLKK